MIYNMLTLTVQLLLTGFLVALVFQKLFSARGSRIIYIDLVLAVMGAFLGTLLEVWFRTVFNISPYFGLVLQFVLPLLSSVGLVSVYRLLNQTRN